MSETDDEIESELDRERGGQPLTPFQRRLLAEASDSSTAPARLAWIAENVWARRYVAGNPNAPLDLLLRLAEESPVEFLANPALPFLLIEQPDLPARLSEQTMLAILRREEAPLAFVKAFAASASKEVARVAALHVGLASELPADNWAPPVAHALDAATLSHDLRFSFLSIWELLVGTPGAPQLPEKELTGENVFRLLVKTRSSTHTPQTETPASNRAEKLRKRIADNLTIDALTLDMAARDPDIQVRMEVARHPLTPRSTRNRLVFDPSPSVRQALAEHPLMSHDLSFRLAHAYLDDGEYADTQAQSGHQRASEQGYTFTNCLGSEAFRPILALNPTLTAAQLWMICDHLFKRTKSDALAAQRLANHPQASEALLYRLADWPDPDVLIGIASHPRTPVALLQSLAKQTNSHLMRQALINTPRFPWNDALKLVGDMMTMALPLSLFSVLLHRPDATIKRSRAAARWMFAHAAKDVFARFAMQRVTYLNGQMGALMLFICASAYLTPADYAPILSSNWWPLRLMAALNPNVSPEALALLTHDGNVCVRAAARATLANLATCSFGVQRDQPATSQE